MKVSGRRTFIVSNLHRNQLSDLNNDITVTLPNSIFSGKLAAINLKHMYLDYSVETIGTSNCRFSVTYPITSTPTVIALDLTNSQAGVVRTDGDLAALIASSINSHLGTTEFQVYFNQIVISSADVYRDNSDLLSNYTIFTSSGSDFLLDFSIGRSLGPIIGFGNEIYSDGSSYTGGNIPPIYSYEAIRISNAAYSTIFKMYDQSTDFACKMDMYDSNNTLITNYLDARDTSISLPVANGFIYNADEFADLIQTEMNRYSDSFTDSPTFSVKFDQQTRLFTISNSENAVFGIGFRFNRSDGSNNYGSLHRQLGFDKRLYLGVSSIVSTRSPRIFEQAYTSEYLFVCSDLIKYNYDASLVVAESEGNASQYESIFTIPVAQFVGGWYNPALKNEHRVNIHSSLLAKQYNENIDAPKQINFYLLLSSGRHIKLNTQWSIKCEIDYE